MKTFAILAALGSFASAWEPFMLPTISTHQPIGNNEGETNFYHIAFNVTSCNSGKNTTTACIASWGDNSWANNEAYSVNVPTGTWIECDSSEFSFQLFPYFSIGNFSLALQQNFTDPDTQEQMLTNGTIHMLNTTDAFTCAINPSEVTYIQHAHGDCVMNNTILPAFLVNVTSAEAIPSCTSKNATAAFEVTGPMTTGQEVFVVGSIPELGSWKPSKAIKLSSGDMSVSNPTFSGSVEIPVGTSFEYKYILRDTSGNKTWECCENREYTVPLGTACSETTVGNAPDYFRSGGSAVQG